MLEDVKNKFYIQGINREESAVSYNILKKLLIAALSIFIVSCYTLPPGEPPAGPIVKVNNYPDIFDQKAAVNYMITSLATRCSPIANAGPALPYVVNEFILSDGSVNNMPIEVWQSMINMKMLIPSRADDPKTRYILMSEIKKTGNDFCENKYDWNMRLLLNEDKTELWKESAEFILTPQIKVDPAHDKIL